MRLGDRYLYLSRHNIFYFRVIVQIAEKGCNVKKEYRRSLQTRSPHLARKLVRAMRWSFDKHCLTGEVGIVEWEKIKAALDEKLLQLIAEEKEIIRRHGPCTIGQENELKVATLPHLRNLLARLSREMRKGGSLQHVAIPQFVEEAVSDAFNGHETPFQSNEQYLQVCEAVLQMLIAFSQEQIVLHGEARSFNHKKNYSPNTVVVTPQEAPSVKGHSLTAVIEEFCKERAKGGNWNKKTTQENRAHYELFVEIVNERPIESIGPEEARYFKKSLQNLPSAEVSNEVTLDQSP